MKTSVQITHSPETWKNLQNEVGQILRECGFYAKVDKNIETTRGTVDVDVYAEDHSRVPEIKYLIECKHWKTRVPKTIVHAFRTVVSDFGANVGLIVSSVGFQSGAFDTVKKSPVKLVNWREFQDLFINVWSEHYFTPELYKVADPLREYTEPINSRIFRKANLLSKERQTKFKELRAKHLALALYALPLFHDLSLFGMLLPKLPIKESLQDLDSHGIYLPQDILDAATLRELLEALSRNCISTIAEFDEVFGERA
ncbi:restriction endonuclease [Candidatus Aerophobetes bacterium]|nr:restriction endonuclease [Candidatus Aerophobetes bacterium]